MTTKNREWAKIKALIETDSEFAEAYRAQRREDQRASLERLRQDPTWVIKQQDRIKKYRAKQKIKKSIIPQDTQDVWEQEIAKFNNRLQQRGISNEYDHSDTRPDQRIDHFANRITPGDNARFDYRKLYGNKRIIDLQDYDPDTIN